jgi:quinol monooxygenase YgiN
VRTVTATFNIIPGKEAEAEAAMRKVADAVRDNEPGVLVYAWHRAAKDPNRILVFEVYADDEAVQNHRTSPHNLEFQKYFAPDTALFDVSSVKLERWDRFTAVQR